ncbi:Transcriptional regulator, TetR family [Arcticibacter svalbardensis MN12-7]|uniref:Transcriptional regulator, TetR family n=1 Tax=Arcticibacter svalbardensis MN12-7 TaxID=1150600 RepID=R9GWT8_9SPHI|nr:TetR/AcrR family transcriptional regulator [Arcticibacter svalbardensis]EOR95990.1 Transcriptional regulator, TetR family [Arcticibacter svalbardensis MN12-7]
MGKKTYEGVIRNKERTKRKFLDAVGDIIRREGHQHLGVNNIARVACANKALIYSYFGNVNNLIDQYARENDYWLLFKDSLEEQLHDKTLNNKDLIKKVLSMQFDFVNSNLDMQKFIIWQVTKRDAFITDILNDRETIGNQFFNVTDQILDKKTDFRAISALLVAGIYHLVLYSKNTSATFCGIDLNTPEGSKRIKNALSNLLDLVYEDSSVSTI